MLWQSGISSPWLSTISPTLVHTYSLSYIRLNYSGHYDVNYLLYLADQPLLGECVTNCALLVIFSGKVATKPSVPLWYYSKCKGFHQWAIASVIIMLPHSAINSDLTDLYLHKSRWDYALNGSLWSFGEDILIKEKDLHCLSLKIQSNKINKLNKQTD